MTISRNDSPDSGATLYGRILENIDRAVIAFDQEGRITLFNPAAEALMQRSSRQMTGQHYKNSSTARRHLLYLIQVALNESRSITDDEGLYLHRTQRVTIAGECLCCANLCLSRQPGWCRHDHP